MDTHKAWGKITTDGELHCFGVGVDSEHPGLKQGITTAWPERAARVPQGGDPDPGRPFASPPCRGDDRLSQGWPRSRCPPLKTRLLGARAHGHRRAEPSPGGGDGLGRSRRAGSSSPPPGRAGGQPQLPRPGASLTRGGGGGRGRGEPGEAERRSGRSRGLQWSRSPEQQPRERRGLERLSAARAGPPAPEPREPPGDEAAARRKAAEAPRSPAQAREPPRPPVVAEPGQEELGPGGKPGTAAGVGGHPRSLPGWGTDPAHRPPPRPQPR